MGLEAVSQAMVKLHQIWSRMVVVPSKSEHFNPEREPFSDSLYGAVENGHIFSFLRKDDLLPMFATSKRLKIE